MPDVILYSTHCPKCNILQEKLEAKGIGFEVIDNRAELLNLGFDHVPVLKVDETLMEFGEANRWVNSIKE